MSIDYLALAAGLARIARDELVDGPCRRHCCTAAQPHAVMTRAKGNPEACATIERALAQRALQCEQCDWRLGSDYRR